MTNTLTQDVNSAAITELQNSFRSNWINSVALIYAFAKTYTSTSLQKALEERGFKITAKANAFTCAAKLAVMEHDVNGNWIVSDVQASRYSKVCMYLNKSDVTVDAVADHLVGKSLNSIIASNKKPVDHKKLQDLFFAGLFEIEQEFNEASIAPSQINVTNLGAKAGANLMVVVTDDAGNITGMSLATGNAKYDELAKEIVRSKAPKEDGKNSLEDAIETAVAA